MFSIKSQLQSIQQNYLDQGSTRKVYIHSDPNFVIKKLLSIPDNVIDPNTVEAKIYEKYKQKYSILTPCKLIGEDLVMERIKTNLAEFLEVEFHGKFSDLEDIRDVNKQVFFGLYDNEISQMEKLCTEANLDIDEICATFNWMLDENMNLWLVDYGALKGGKICFG